MIVNHLDLIKLWPPCHPHQGRHKGWQRDHRFSPVLLELRKYSIGVILSSVSSGEEEENKGILLGKGSQEEKRTKSGLLPNQGGVGVSEGSKKTKVFQKQNSILENNFQWACRIILGPPKHVVHLVWLFFAFRPITPMQTFSTFPCLFSERFHPTISFLWNLTQIWPDLITLVVTISLQSKSLTRLGQNWTACTIKNVSISERLSN